MATEVETQILSSGRAIHTHTHTHRQAHIDEESVLYTLHYANTGKGSRARSASLSLRRRPRLCEREDESRLRLLHIILRLLYFPPVFSLQHSPSLYSFIRLLMLYTSSLYKIFLEFNFVWFYFPDTSSQKSCEQQSKPSAYKRLGSANCCATREIGQGLAIRNTAHTHNAIRRNIVYSCVFNEYCTAVSFFSFFSSSNKNPILFCISFVLSSTYLYVLFLIFLYPFFSLLYTYMHFYIFFRLFRSLCDVPFFPNIHIQYRLLFDTFVKKTFSAFCMQFFPLRFYSRRPNMSNNQVYIMQRILCCVHITSFLQVWG